jgi:hypothetical protein
LDDSEEVVMVVMEKKGHERPDFFSRLRCSSLCDESISGSGDATMRWNVHWIVLCVPAAEGDVAIEARGEIVARELGSIYEACTGHLRVSGY